MDYFSLAIVLATIGLLLFLTEYMIPTGGFLIIGGILVWVGAVVVIASNTEDVRETIGAIVLLCIGAPTLTIVGMNVLAKRLALKAEDLPEAGESPLDNIADQLVGRVGRTVTPLRPAGAVEFDGRRVDAVSEGVFIDVGAWVKCIEAKGVKIVVRQLPKPPDLGDLEMSDLK
jgi:membrane-bound ClpP family serine protease